MSIIRRATSAELSTCRPLHTVPSLFKKYIYARARTHARTHTTIFRMLYKWFWISISFKKISWEPGLRNWCSAVRGSNSVRGKGFFSSTNDSDHRWAHPVSYVWWVQGIITGVTHPGREFQPLTPSMLRMNGAIPLFSYMPSWRGEETFYSFYFLYSKITCSSLRMIW
jgi:hypothetical protein